MEVGASFQGGNLTFEAVGPNKMLVVPNRQMSGFQTRRECDDLGRITLN